MAVSHRNTAFVAVLVLCAELSSTQFGISSLDSEAPIRVLSQGKEVRLGMTRAELLDTLGPPPEGFDYGDEMLWAPPSNVWRCFLKNERVVGIQTSCLVQNNEVLVDHESSKWEFRRRLGRSIGKGPELVFPQDEKRLVVALEPEAIGHQVTFIAMATPDFPLSHFYGWARPISQTRCAPQPFAKPDGS